jgi:broad specificity phosphatase PhoE
MINGFLRTKIASFVMNLHTTNRPIYMCRAGETQFIKRGLIGGDSELTPAGIEFAKALGDFLQYDDSGFSCLRDSNTLENKGNSSSDSPKAMNTSNKLENDYDFDNFGYVLV